MQIRTLVWAGLAAATLATSPLAAQDNGATAIPPAGSTTNNSSDAVGPAQLRDFSLGGTVTRNADRPAAPTTTAPATAAPTTTAPAQPRRTVVAPAPGSSPAVVRPTPRAAAPQPAPGVPAADTSVSSPSGSATVDLRPAQPVHSAQPGLGDGFGQIAIPESANTVVQERSWGLWPWLLLALALGGAGAYLALRQRRDPLTASGPRSAAPTPTPTPVQRDYIPTAPSQPAPRGPTPARPATAAPVPAGAIVGSDGGIVSSRVSASSAALPASAPLPNPPASAPAPATPAPAMVADDGGIISTRLSPSLSIDLRPLRVMWDDAGAVLAFELILANNGSAPARDILAEAKMVNAGPDQDQQIAAFFQNPVGQGDRLPIIPPRGRIALKSQVRMPTGAMNVLEVEGRRLFVPLLAVNTLYRWSGGEAQSSASFLVGRGGEDGGRMAPFRLDQGSKSWTGLNARRHSDGLTR